MPADYKRSFERLVAARERLVELRGERIGQLLRLRMYLRTRLGDFLTNTDPIGGMRLAELGAEGSKAYGDLALNLTFFDGSRLRIAIERTGRYVHAGQPDVFGEVAQIVDLRVSPDLSTTEVDYLPAGDDDGPARTVDFATFLDALVEHVVASMEAQVARPRAEGAGDPARRSGLTFSVR